jgi:cobalamin biosynthesis Co2+ chelatase CbiK
MTTLEKFQEEANINFVQAPLHSDVEIGELNTADGYELFYITQDIRNLNYENEVFYYKPDFDSIMDEIKNATVFKPSESIVNVCVYDIEDWFDEYDMLNWLESEMDEEEFEAFTNEKE